MLLLESVDTVNKMIYGDNASTEIIVKICRALKVDIDEIVSLEDGDINDVK
ncbi:DNA-binding Xre family transcriptional regulator [Bacilli bacterium PM5-9]|nr:DNA-binding Xre family transcriptional regulator [Bacilli bacterium PM5-9]